MNRQVIQKKKVFVGMSGGVDSSVSAALLQDQGYDVTGVFIKVWQPDWISCTWKEDRLDAMRVAAKIGIPFVTLDLEKEYKTEVVDYMIREYKEGRTPNPDVMCNRHIKFGGFLEWAKKQRADFVATGHYARLRRREFPIKSKNLKSDLDLTPYNLQLLTGIDKNKDQSYFLWTLTQKDLEHILFPVGGLEKPKVRELANKFGLPTAKKKDSQGLCFIGKVDMKEFLSHYIKLKKGQVLNHKGKVIGEHGGASLYTIGERHGFIVHKKTPNDPPLYVVSKNIENNTITVDMVPVDVYNGSKTVFLEKVNWINGEPTANKRYSARLRYREPLQACKLTNDNGRWNILFDSPEKAVSSGQSAVIYDGEACVGGGIII